MSRKVAMVARGGRVAALPAVKAFARPAAGNGFAAQAARIRQAFARPGGLHPLVRQGGGEVTLTFGWAVLRGRGIDPHSGQLRPGAALPARRPVPFDLGPRSAPAGHSLVGLLNWMARNGHRRVVLEIR
jgi:hypothetical protein